jgi:hypothetical protein
LSDAAGKYARFLGRTKAVAPFLQVQVLPPYAFMITDHGEPFHEIHLPCACVLLSLRVDRGIYRVPRRRDDPRSTTPGHRFVSCPSLQRTQADVGLLIDFLRRVYASGILRLLESRPTTYTLGKQTRTPRGLLPIF